MVNGVKQMLLKQQAMACTHGSLDKRPRQSAKCTQDWGPNLAKNAVFKYKP